MGAHQTLLTMTFRREVVPRREESGELLWDLTAVEEHVPFLTAHLLPEALGTLIANPETQDRLREIALGRD